LAVGEEPMCEQGQFVLRLCSTTPNRLNLLRGIADCQGFR
jgi:hypothetical protein